MEVAMNPLHKQMLDDVFDAFTMLTSGNMVSLMHVDGGYTRYNKSAVDLFGLPAEYIRNGEMNWNDYLHPEDRKRYMDVMMPLLEGKTQTYDITYRVMTTRGEYQVIRAVGAVLRGNDGKPSLIGGALFNEGLLNRSDPITVLPNKNAFLEDLKKMIREGQGIFALQVGISQFAQINKVHGYSYGNRILQETAWLMQEAVGQSGTVYRLDGATFAVLSVSLTRERIAALYDHIRYQLQRGIEINGINNILLTNGGLISVFNADADVTTLCSCLNYAQDESENHMHGELIDFNGSINYEQNEAIEMLSVIRASIEENCAGFHMEYLPVICVKTKRMTGAEAKIYWENEKYGRVEPNDFLPILEHDFIFEEIGDFMIRQALFDGVKFLKTDPDFLLCLNVYRLQLESGYFVENLIAYVNESGFPPELLSLKFDSDCRLIGLEKMKEIIAAIHDYNVLVVIGDFGSGLDSIRFLQSEAVDAVSIDGIFANNLKENVKDRSTLLHLAAIAKDYVEHINVKGIDSKELRDIAETLPITTMQGDFFSKPLTAEQIIITDIIQK